MATNAPVAAKAAPATNKITIDGAEYSLDDLTPEAKTQIRNLRLVEQQIRRLQTQLAISQTARAAYGGMLKAQLAKKA